MAIRVTLFSVHESSNPTQQNQPGQMEDLISDLVRDWELQYTMQPGYTVHTKYISDPARGIRRRAVEEKWERDGAKALGRGTFGTVWFERCTSGPSAGQVRAVKQIYKNFGPMSVSTKALSGELSAIMKFSHQLVLTVYTLTRPYICLPFHSIDIALFSHLGGTTVRIISISPWSTFLVAICRDI